MKKQTKADKAFIAKIGTLNIGTGKGHACGLKCPICGKSGHSVKLGMVRVQRMRKSAGEEQSLAE